MLYMREHLIPNSMNNKIQQYNYLTFLNTLKIPNYLANTEKKKSLCPFLQCVHLFSGGVTSENLQQQKFSICVVILKINSTPPS